MESTRRITISDGFRVPLFCILSVELVVGFAACISVVWVYWKKRCIRTAANMFITNLAVVDAFMCIAGIPFTLARLGIFPVQSQLFCLCHEGITSSLRNASMGTLLFICYDRYESIMSPFRIRSNFKRTRRTLVILWLCSAMTFPLPFIEYSSANYSIVEQPCIYYFSNTTSSFKARLYYCPAFVIATLISLPCYWKISKAALSRIHIQSIVVKTSLVIPMGSMLNERANTARLRQKEWRVAKMTGAIMCSVCILWFPYMLFTFILCFLQPNSTLAKLEYVFLTLGYFNCTLNPLLYAFTKQKFRNAFVRALPTKCCR